MKVFLVLTCFILAVTATVVNQHWEQFKVKHGKSYKSPIEEKLRFSVFQQSLKTIEAHNAKFERGESTYKMGINQFGDLTPAEFKATLNYKKVDFPFTEYFISPENYTLPFSVDWRYNGAVLEVKNQGQNCGSCWAFSTIGSIEGQNAIHHGKKIPLSEQELVDCSRSYGNKGCEEGELAPAFKYIQDNGIAAESDYPYIAKDGTCKKTNRADVKVTSFVHVAASEYELEKAVASVGPISIGLNAYKLQFYSSGIFDADCSKAINHGVLAVGYGTQGKDFWIIKNSWGGAWGENGYFRIVRNKNNMCGLADDSFYPNIA